MRPQQLQVQDKKELEAQEEGTRSGRYYLPSTDIHETADALAVMMEMPGVDKESIDIKLEKNILTITGNLDVSTYEGLEPVYTEYNIGNYVRSFTISSEIDRDAISATMADGVLLVKLPKHKEAATKRIEVR